MSVVGTLVETSLLQTAQAQHVASTKRGRERAEIEDRARRYRDQVELKVAGVEATEAVRPLPPNNSEQQHEEEAARPHDRTDDHGRLDVQA